MQINVIQDDVDVLVLPATPVVEKLRVARRGHLVLRGHRCRLDTMMTIRENFDNKLKNDDDKGKVTKQT